MKDTVVISVRGEGTAEVKTNPGNVDVEIVYEDVNKCTQIYSRYTIIGTEPPPKKIELDIYEDVPNSPGYVQYVGKRKMKDIFDKLVEHLKKCGLYPDEYFHLSDDDIKYGKNPDKVFPEFRWISCYAVTGDSEGHYIHIDAILPDGKRELLFLGKTLIGFLFASKVANECAWILGA